MGKTAITLLSVFVSILFLVPVNANLDFSDITAVTIQINGPGVEPLPPTNSYIVNTTTNWMATQTLNIDGESQAESFNLERVGNTLVAVWSWNNEVWFSNSTNDGQTWSTPVDISNDTGTAWDRTSESSTIVVSNNIVYVVWADTTGNNFIDEYVSFRSTTDGGNTWTPSLGLAPTRIYTGGPRRTAPQLAIDGNDMYVLTGDYNFGNTYLFISTDFGQTWGAGIWLRNNANQMTPVVINGNLSYVYRLNVGGGRYDIFWDITDAGNTTLAADFTQYAVSNTTRFSTSPAMIRSGNNIYVAWEEDFGGGATGNDIVWRRTGDLGQNWTPALNVNPATVFASAGESKDPSLALVDGELYALWEEYAGGGATRNIMMASWHGTGNSFEAPFRVTERRTEDNVNPVFKRYGYTDSNSDNYIEWLYIDEEPADYDIVYSNYLNHRPIITWTGEIGYAVDGIEPDTGVSGQVYTFRVNYTDEDDDAPGTGYPRLMVDLNIDGDFDDPGEKLQMDEVDALDTDHTDGKYYEMDVTGYSALGVSQYAIIVNDTNDFPARGSAIGVNWGPTITAFNWPPKLWWTEELEYENDGLDPETGDPATEFNFGIRYIDPDNDAPGVTYPKVLIDTNDDGIYTGTEDLNYSLLAASTSDTSYDNGKVYTKTVTLSPGDYTYMFVTEDAVGLPAKTENRTGPSVGTTGNAPTLALTGEAGFTTDGVEPNTGFDTTDFRFRVSYSDQDDDAPKADSVMVWIDMDNDTIKDAPEWFVMTEVDVNDVVYTDGKLFRYSTTLPEGDYNHSFKAEDANGNTATTADFVGPKVSGHNERPTLSWIGAGEYTNDGIDPNVGDANITTFVYKVVYADADGNAPDTGHPQVWVDLNLDSMEDAGEIFAMSEENASDTDHTDGKTYTYSRTFAESGTYHYRFIAMDINGAEAVANDPVNAKEGPIVNVEPIPNDDPVLDWVGSGAFTNKGVNPVVGTTLTLYEYRIKYSDTEGDLPAAGEPVVKIFRLKDDNTTVLVDTLPMEEEDTGDVDATDGKMYVITTQFDTVGDYTYVFAATTVDGAIAVGPATIEMDGPEVMLNNEPVLAWLSAQDYLSDGLNPELGEMGITEFTYKVKYSDPEGDAPKAGYPEVWIDDDMDGTFGDTEKHAMTLETGGTNDGNYANGEIFVLASKKFDAVGTSKYKFVAFDTINNPATGEATTARSGPVVSEPVVAEPPVLIAVTTSGGASTDGLEPNRGKTDQNSFTFSVKYKDANGDAPADGFPVLKIYIGGGSTDVRTFNMSTTETAPNFKTGVVYTYTVANLPEGGHTYEFAAMNVIDESTTLGLFDGPFVMKEETSNQGGEGANETEIPWWWYLLIVLMLVIGLVVGVAAGRSRRKPDVPTYEESTGPRPPRQADLGPSAEDDRDYPPEDDYPPENDDIPVEDAPAAGSTSEQPGPDAGPAPEPEKEPDLADKSEDGSEAPPEDSGEAKEAEKEVKEEERPTEKEPAKDPDGKAGESEQQPDESGVDEEIDDILSRLD